MKRRALLLCLLGLAAGGASAEPPSTNAVAACRQTALDLGRALRGRLEQALRERGPLDAIDVCKTEAPALARRTGEAAGRTVGRTALRVRNPENTPDAWARGVLTEWNGRAPGVDWKTVEASAVVTNAAGRRELRYLKPIIMEPLCLACHGEAIEPTLAARIQSLYPADQARGFREGQLRGAFTVTEPFEQTNRGEQR